MAYKIRRVVYDDVSVERDGLVTLTQAAKLLDMTKQGIINAIFRGQLTEIIDEEKTYQGRRLLLKAELETYQSHKIKN